MRRLALGLTLTLALSSATLAADALAPETTAVSSESPALTEYLGRWTYDLPDRDRGINIAELHCPATEPDCTAAFPYLPNGATTLLPQIGDIVFTQGPDGTVIGRTDHGCTWQFAVHRHSLELDHTPQSCLNPAIRSGYTLTAWSISVAGSRERETITGISHNPVREYDFVLDHGRRTKVDDRKDTARLFTGAWEYDPADPNANINMGIYRSEGADGAPQIRAQPQTGIVTVTSDRAHAITVHTPDGCQWTFTVRGNTAFLHPAMQTCHRPDATVEIEFWTIASDGRHQASTITADVQRDGVSSSYYLPGGALTKQRPAAATR